MQNYIHVYTGDGKGKTTASLGVVLRTLGFGKKVLFAQFTKCGEYSEIKALSKFKDQVICLQFGKKDFIYKNPSAKDISEAVEGWEKICATVAGSKFDLIVLDELNIALYYQLLDEQKVISTLVEFKKDSEIIITGREASSNILELADLVTEMKEVKHYYTKGVQAREGIEF